MDITTRAKAAHLRLMSTLPVRTHERKPEPLHGREEFRAYYQQWKRQRVRELLEAGTTNEKIRELVHVGSALITEVRREMGLAIPKL